MRVVILDDLITHVSVAVSGWLREKNAAGTVTTAWRSHGELLSIARSISPSSGLAIDGQGWRGPLFKRINQIGDALIRQCLSNYESMYSSGVQLELVCWTERGKTRCRYEPLVYFVPIFQFIEAFKLAPLVRDLPVTRQRPFVLALELLCESEYLREHLSYAKRAKEEASITEFSQLLDQTVAQIADIESSLDASGKALLVGIRAPDLLYGQSCKHIPPRIDVHANQDAIKWVADLYDDVSEELSVDLEADPRTPADLQAATKAAWESLRDCGQAFSVLASWLRASNVSEATRRCKLCYRHLGHDMKSFCAEHKRTSKKRQPARALQVATVYEATHKKFVSGLPEIEAIFSTHALLNVKANASLVSHACKFVDRALAPASANLAALLRQLYPVIEPVLQDSISAHFAALLKAANEPFTKSSRYAGMPRWRISQIKEQAPKTLDLFTFFRTFYGDANMGTQLADFVDYKCMDLDHPLTRGESVLPRKLAIDLGHLKCWKAADDSFDQRFYLSMAAVSKLRNSTLLAGKRKRSFVDIGLEVGASSEAVRELIDFSQGLSKTSNRRERILPSKQALLTQPLELTAVKFSETLAG